MRSVSATLIGFLALAVSSASAAGSSSAIPKPLEVYHAYYHNGQGGQLLSLLVSDPRTSTQTGCSVTAPSAGGWLECDNDKTFSFKIDTWQPTENGWTLSVKHQYRFNGEACLHSTGPDCVTVVGYAKFPIVNGNCSATGSECVLTVYDTSSDIGFEKTINTTIESYCKAGVCKNY